MSAGWRLEHPGWQRPAEAKTLPLVDVPKWTPREGTPVDDAAGALTAGPSWAGTAASRSARLATAAAAAARRARALRPTRGHLLVARDLFRAGGVEAVVQRTRRKLRAQPPAASKAPEPPFERTVVVPAEPWPAALPLVSVVIPNYNNGRFLEQCLQSLARQTMRRFEVLVVDSASSDPTSIEALARLEADPPVPFRVLRREERHLLGCNRNAGWQQARGRYVSFLDPDDVLAPTYLDACTFLLEFQEYDIVGSGVHYFEGSSGWWADMPLTTTLEQAQQRCPTSAPALVRRDLLAAAAGFHDTGLGEHLVYEDWKLWVRALALGARLRNVPAQLLEVRVHLAGQSRHAAIPEMPDQRRAIARYNADVLTPEARLRSARRARTRYVVEGAEAAVAAARTPSPVLLLVRSTTSCRDDAVRAAVAAWQTEGRDVVVVAEAGPPSARGIDWGPAAGLPSEDVHVLGELLPVQDWLSYCRYLVASKGVRQVWRVLHGEPEGLSRQVAVSLPDTRVADIVATDFTPLIIV